MSAAVATKEEPSEDPFLSATAHGRRTNSRRKRSRRRGRAHRGTAAEDLRRGVKSDGRNRALRCVRAPDVRTRGAQLEPRRGSSSTPSDPDEHPRVRHPYQDPGTGLRTYPARSRRAISGHGTQGGQPATATSQPASSGRGAARASRWRAGAPPPSRLPDAGKVQDRKNGRLARFANRPDSATFSERETGLEPATSTLARWHSTTELLPRSRGTS